MAQQPSGELASTDPTRGAQDAGVQECGIQRFLSVYAATYNTFNVQRTDISKATGRSGLRLQTWREVAAADDPLIE